MQDRSFQEAMQDLQDQFAGDIQEHVRHRLSALTGHTAASLVTDIENTHMQSAVLDVLRLLKIVAFLDTLGSMDLLNEAELQELKAYIHHLHAQAFPQNAEGEQK